MEGDCRNFPWKNFCLTVQKHFLEEPYSAVFQKNSGSEKVCGKEVGGASVEYFRRKLFVSKCRKKFAREYFSLSLISGIE